MLGGLQIRDHTWGWSLGPAYHEKAKTIAKVGHKGKPYDDQSF